MQINHKGNLTKVKRDAITKVNTEAGLVRSRYITAIPGQEMIYLEKRLEAEALMANQEIPENETPHITREAISDGVSRFEKAVEILTMRQLWLNVSPEIEVKRREAIRAIESATSIKEVLTVREVQW